MKFWTTAPEEYDYSYTVDTYVRHGLKLGHIYRLVAITDPDRVHGTKYDSDTGTFIESTRVQYQCDRYLSGLYPSIPFESLQQELP